MGVESGLVRAGINMRRHRKGLSVPQFRAFQDPETARKPRSSCVADHLGASLPTTSRIIANLVNKGFIARTFSLQDRRQMILSLTSRRRAIIDSARKAALQSIESECAALSPHDRGIIVHALEILGPFVAGSQQSTSAAISPVLPASNGSPKMSRTNRPGVSRA